MSNEQNTENEPLSKGEKRALGAATILGRVFLIALDAVLFGIFSYNVFLILQHHYDFGTVVFAAVAFFYLLADAVNQGVRRALGGMVKVAQDDTPTS